MKLGVSISSTHKADGPQLMIERTKAAYAAGFTSLTIGDHHNMPVPYAQNTPMLGRLLAEWPDRPAGCLFLVPLWPPLLMAEHIGTLAAMHAAPFIVQTGIGSGEAQFAALNASLRTRGKVLEASVDAVKGLLAGDVVDAEGLGMVGGQVGLLPNGPVEWWISAGADVALRRAARIGDAWYASPDVTPERGKEMVGRYRDAGGTRATIRKDILVMGDGDQARARATELVNVGYRGMGMESLLVGSPDDVAEDLKRYEAAGFEEAIVRCMTVPQEVALESLTLLGALSS